MNLRTYSKSFDKCEPTFTLSAFTSLTFLQSIRATFHEELVARETLFVICCCHDIVLDTTTESNASLHSDPP